MNDGLITHIQKYWTIYFAILTLVISYTTLGNRLDNVEARLDIVESTQNSNEILLVEIQKDIVEVKTTLQFIKMQVQ